MKKFLLCLILFIFPLSLVGCSNQDNEKIIKYDVIYQINNQIFVNDVCKVVNTKKEFEELCLEDEFILQLENFDYDNYSLICLTTKSIKAFDEPTVTELKIVEEQITIDLCTKAKILSPKSDWSFIIKVLKEDIVNVLQVNYIENQYDYAMLKIDLYSGGCIPRVIEVPVPKGKKAIIDRDLINLETLEVYKGEIITNEDLYLYPYKENGLDAHFIREYVMNNNEFEFNSGFYNIEKIKEYQVIEENENFIIIEHKNVKYSFLLKSELSNPRLYAIESTNNLFNKNYEQAHETLTILYNNASFFENDLITIMLTKDNYKITFPSYPIYG